MARTTIAELKASLVDITRNVTNALTSIGAHDARIAKLEERVAELERTPQPNDCGKDKATRVHEPAHPIDERYPLKDYRGRPYRLEGKVKCFAPGH